MARYQFVRRLGQGAFTVVHLARELPSRRDSAERAVKALLPAFAGNAFHQKRFEREARACERLVHENFVRTLELDEVSGQSVQVMEYLDGVTLSTVLEAAKRLGQKVPLGEVCFIVEQVGQGLGFLLEKAAAGAPFVPGIGPRNVLLTRQGQVKLTSFGRTRTTEELPGTPQSADGTVYATLEQLRNEADNLGGDARALGSLLVRLLLGAKDDRETSRRLRRLRSTDTPEPLVEVAARAIDLQHPEHHRSVEAFLEALADARDALSLRCSKEGLSTLVCRQSPAAGDDEDEATVTYVPNLGLPKPARRSEPVTSPEVPIVVGEPVSEPAQEASAQADEATVIRRPLLGELLRLQGKLDPVLLEQAAVEARFHERRLGDVLREQGLVEHADLLKALGEQSEQQYVLDETLADAEPTDAARLILPQDSKRLKALPLIATDDELVVAMEDPTDEDALIELKTLTGYERIRGVFASPAALAAAWRRFYLAAAEPTTFDVQIDVQAPVSSTEPTMIVQVEKLQGPRKR